MLLFLGWGVPSFPAGALPGGLAWASPAPLGSYGKGYNGVRQRSWTSVAKRGKGYRTGARQSERGIPIKSTLIDYLKANPPLDLSVSIRAYSDMRGS